MPNIYSACIYSLIIIYFLNYYKSYSLRILTCSSIIAEPSVIKKGDIIGCHWDQHLVYTGLVEEQPPLKKEGDRTVPKGRILYFSDKTRYKFSMKQVRFKVLGFTNPESVQYEDFPDEILEAEAHFSEIESKGLRFATNPDTMYLETELTIGANEDENDIFM